MGRARGPARGVAEFVRRGLLRIDKRCERVVKVLAIETSGRDLGVALVGPEGTVASFGAAGTRRHVELLLPAIDSVLVAAGVMPDELDGIVVDVGPGLFTGLRAGVAAAKGLALGVGIPLVGLRSTAVLRAALSDICSSVAAATDVRRGEVAYELPGDDRASIGTLDVLFDRVAALDFEEPLVAVGNGWLHEREAIALRFGPKLRFGGADFENPSAGVLGRVGLSLLQAGHGVDAGALSVEYLRDADAAITWTTRATEGV